MHFSCPQCEKQYPSSPALSGRRVSCTACGEQFVVDADALAASNGRENTVTRQEATFSSPAGVAASSGAPVKGTSTATAGVSARGGPTDSTRDGDDRFSAGDQDLTSAPMMLQGGQSGDGGRRHSDEIDYQIFGHESQYVEVRLDPGEQTIAEAGALMYLDDDIEMNTVLGDPSSQDQGLLSKAFSAGKRVMTGESLFMTTFTNTGPVARRVAFGAPFPGQMVPLHLDQLGNEVICQKDAFLCGARGITVDIALQKKIGAGLFGGEGFIMQRLRGDGIAIIHAGGSMMYRELERGERLRVDTGCLMAMGPTVRYDIRFVGGMKNAFFGGEGLFLATLDGPGPVWLQSLPFSRLAGRVRQAMPGIGGKHQGEGSLLGGLGDMLMGD